MIRYSFLLLVFLLFACSSDSDNEFVITDSKSDNQNAEIASVFLNSDGDVKWNPDDSWQELPAYSGSIASLNAKVGGTFRDYTTNYPSHFLVIGTRDGEQRTLVTSYTHEGLLDYDEIKQVPARGIATHMKTIIPNKYYMFRIDPKARWWNGNEMTTLDFQATYDWSVDPNNPDALDSENYAKFEFIPKSKYIFEVKLNGISFIEFSTDVFFYIVPHEVASTMSIKEYAENNKQIPLMGSGPYSVDTGKTVKDKILVLKRNPNWWKRYRQENKNTYNFDNLETLAVTDRDAAKKLFIAGNIDIFSVTLEEWYEEFNPKTTSFRALKQGLVGRYKGFGYKTNLNISNFALSTKNPPTNDIRVRKAINLLYPHDKINKELYYGERVRTKSLFYQTPYENKVNQPDYKYNPKLANKLLDEAGWNGERTKEGFRTNKQGEVLEMELPSTNLANTQKYEGLFLEELKKSGFKIDIKPMQWSSFIDKFNSKDFTIITLLASGGTLISSPRSWYYSSGADEPNSLNMWGYKNKKVDELFDKFDKLYPFDPKDREKQIKYMKEVDRIITDDAIWVYRPHYKYKSLHLAWNKFDNPGKVTFQGYYRNKIYWWIDLAKEAKVNKFIKGDTSVSMKPIDLELKAVKP